jgi:hypothetical protein
MVATHRRARPGHGRVVTIEERSHLEQHVPGLEEG